MVEHLGLVLVHQLQSWLSSRTWGWEVLFSNYRVGLMYPSFLSSGDSGYPAAVLSLVSLLLSERTETAGESV